MKAKQRWLNVTRELCHEWFHKTASFQKEAMRTHVALWLFYEVKLV